VEALEDKVAAAERLYREDVAGGHITVLTEVIAASLAHPELGRELVARLKPWLEFTQAQLEAALPAEAPLPALSFGLVALYLGLNLLTRLDPKRVPVDELFGLMQQLFPIAASGG
jgi:hypothetical protein